MCGIVWGPIFFHCGLVLAPVQRLFYSNNDKRVIYTNGPTASLRMGRRWNILGPRRAEQVTQPPSKSTSTRSPNKLVPLSRSHLLRKTTPADPASLCECQAVPQSRPQAHTFERLMNQARATLTVNSHETNQEPLSLVETWLHQIMDSCFPITDRIYRHVHTQFPAPPQ